MTWQHWFILASTVGWVYTAITSFRHARRLLHRSRVPGAEPGLFTQARVEAWLSAFCWAMAVLAALAFLFGGKS